MVEAALYFPIAIAVVMAVIYLGLFKMQESYFLFQIERTASLLAREIANPGYEEFTGEKPLENSSVDFSWEDGPTQEQVRAYYAAYGGSVTKLYRLGLDNQTQTRIKVFQKALCQYSTLFSMGNTEAYIKINNGFLSKSVQAEIRYVIPTPGILRYLGVQDSLTLYAGAYQPVLNTTDFVRNVDLAFDLGEFLMKKLGMENQMDEFTEKFSKVKELLF